jgi:hypothetical protein
MNDTRNKKRYQIPITMYSRNSKRIHKKRSLVTGSVWPRGFQEVWAPRFHNIRHIKMVRLSASCTGRFYPQKFSWHSFSLGAIVRSEGNMSLKNPGTVRLVAQRLNHYATPAPKTNTYTCFFLSCEANDGARPALFPIRRYF